jgi:hypothetical protein
MPGGGQAHENVRPGLLDTDQPDHTEHIDKHPRVLGNLCVLCPIGRNEGFWLSSKHQEYADCAGNNDSILLVGEASGGWNIKKVRIYGFQEPIVFPYRGQYLRSESFSVGFRKNWIFNRELRNNTTK